MMRTTVRELNDLGINIFSSSPITELNIEYLWQCFRLLYENKQTIFKVPECQSADDVISYVTMLLTTYSYKYNGLIASTKFTYSPIDNYNMDETHTQTDNFTDTRKGTDGVTTTGNSTGSVKGFDATDFADRDKTQVSNTQENTIDETNTNTGTRETTTTRKGNIGVTTTQQMIEQERKVLDFNIYEIICEDVADKILLKVF